MFFMIPKPLAAARSPAGKATSGAAAAPLGYFFYSREYRAYVEVISFDRLVNIAKERNRAFFDKLGLSTT
jgi:hypothetical protein